MSNPSDNGPLAPRRSLSKAGPAGSGSEAGGSTGTTHRATSEAGTQPVKTPPYGGNPQPYSSAEVEPGRTFPVPPAPADADETRTTAAPAVEKKQPGSDVRTASRTRTVRRAKLRLMRVDPWSVTKVSLLFSIAFGIMCVVAVFLVFSIMSAAGLWDHINQTIQGVLNQDKATAFDINDYVAMNRVMGITMLISAIDVVLVTALATLGAFIYNMAASLLGGIEITLAEDVK